MVGFDIVTEIVLLEGGDKSIPSSSAQIGKHLGDPTGLGVEIREEFVPEAQKETFIVDRIL